MSVCEVVFFRTARGVLFLIFFYYFVPFSQGLLEMDSDKRWDAGQGLACMGQKGFNLRPTGLTFFVLFFSLEKVFIANSFEKIYFHLL